MTILFFRFIFEIKVTLQHEKTTTSLDDKGETVKRTEWVPKGFRTYVALRKQCKMYLNQQHKLARRVSDPDYNGEEEVELQDTNCSCQVNR